MENMEFLKAMLAKMNENIKVNQKKVDANKKAMQDMPAKIDTNRETHGKALKEMQAKMKDTMESQIGFLRTEKLIGKK
jgi:septation ring formation regulator EzrA